jgi:hypothetical protein
MTALSSTLKLAASHLDLKNSKALIICWLWKVRTLVIYFSVYLISTLVLILPCHGQEKTAERKSAVAAGPQLDEVRHIGVSYNSSSGMVSFSNEEAFHKVVESLDQAMEAFQYDHGQTDLLLKILATNQETDALYKLLLQSSPLSDRVLITFLKGNHPADKVEAILLANAELSEAVEGVYQQVKLPREARARIEDQRFQHVPYTPVLDDFERSFPGFRSLRSQINAAEMQFLLRGGDPKNKENPANNNTFDRTVATILNARREVQIGRAIYVLLPGRNIKIVNGDLKVLDYIRTHGAIPRNSILLKEPANGLPIAAAPPPVDSNIVVDTSGTERENGCGGADTSSSTIATTRFAFSAKAKDPKSTYYWNFGDGYVSYQKSPVHSFTDHASSHTVVLTTYDEVGAACGSGSGPGPGPIVVSSTNGTCSVDFTSAGSGPTVSFNATPSGTPPFTYMWAFGDSGFATVSTPSVNHTYPPSNNWSVSYTVQLTMKDGTGCTAQQDHMIAVNGTPSSASPSCCDVRDRGLEPRWYDADDTHKFKHTLALHHWPWGSRVNAEVVTYKKTRLGIWWWSKDYAQVDVVGIAYAGKDHDACIVPNSFGPWETKGDAIWHSAHQNFNGKAYVQYNSVTSQGSAFGGSNTANITDCN